MVGPVVTLAPTTPAPPPAEEGSHFQSEESRSEYFQDTARFLVACDSPESHVIPAKAGIHWAEKWTPAFAGVTPLIFIASGGPKAHGNSPENHAVCVIPAESGIHRTDNGCPLSRGRR